MAIENSYEEEPAEYSSPVVGASWRELHVPESMAGRRLDQALAELIPEHSRNRLQGWVRDGAVLVDGACADPKRKVRGGERLLLRAPEGDPARGDVAQEMPLDVVYEDQALLVIDKPAGLVVHPGSGNPDGTLLNALLHHAPELERVPRAGIVHRLDKDTSGLLVVARSLEAQTDLVRQLQARTVKRHYLAVVQGRILSEQGRVEQPIGRHAGNRTRMAVVEGGKPAVTHFRVRDRFAECTLVECRLETGRTHQIRVHMAYLGHPLVGDSTYQGRRARKGPPFPRQALHAYRLGLIHPTERRACEWSIPLAADLVALLEGLPR